MPRRVLVALVAVLAVLLSGAADVHANACDPKDMCSMCVDVVGHRFLGLGPMDCNRFDFQALFPEASETSCPGLEKKQCEQVHEAISYHLERFNQDLKKRDAWSKTVAQSGSDNASPPVTAVQVCKYLSLPRTWATMGLASYPQKAFCGALPGPWTQEPRVPDASKPYPVSPLNYQLPSRRVPVPQYIRDADAVSDVVKPVPEALRKVPGVPRRVESCLVKKHTDAQPLDAPAEAAEAARILARKGAPAPAPAETRAPATPYETMHSGAGPMREVGSVPAATAAGGPGRAFNEGPLADAVGVDTFAEGVERKPDGGASEGTPVLGEMQGDVRMAHLVANHQEAADRPDGRRDVQRTNPASTPPLPAETNPLKAKV